MKSEKEVRQQLEGRERLLAYEQRTDRDPLWMAELRGAINALRFVLYGTTSPDPKKYPS